MMSAKICYLIVGPVTRFFLPDNLKQFVFHCVPEAVYRKYYSPHLSWVCTCIIFLYLVQWPTRHACPPPSALHFFKLQPLRRSRDGYRSGVKADCLLERTLCSGDGCPAVKAPRLWSLGIRGNVMNHFRKCTSIYGGKWEIRHVTAYLPS